MDFSGRQRNCIGMPHPLLHRRDLHRCSARLSCLSRPVAANLVRRFAACCLFDVSAGEESAMIIESFDKSKIWMYVTHGLQGGAQIGCPHSQKQVWGRKSIS